jgi:hypothetical protein
LATPELQIPAPVDDRLSKATILGIGVGLFYSSITTAAITALDPSQASLAGAIVCMFQIAGGSIGVGFNTAIVVSGSSMPAGIHTAFLVAAYWPSAAQQ